MLKLRRSRARHSLPMHGLYTKQMLLRSYSIDINYACERICPPALKTLEAPDPTVQS